MDGNKLEQTVKHQSEISITNLVAGQYCKYSMNEDKNPAGYEEQARDFLESLETEINGCWNYETAEKVYQRIYQFHIDRDIKSYEIRYNQELTNVVRNFVAENNIDVEINDETINDNDIEYEVRKETEKIYEEFCRAINRPFIVLCDLFYDIQKYSTKHIMGYRYRTIVEKSRYYAERYRTDENTWFWKSIDKALELRSRYHDEGVGEGTDMFDTVVLSYYLFDEHLALLSYKCNHLCDEFTKHQAIVEFVNFQYRGYPNKVFLGYPVMYKDICSFIGVSPVNLVSYEETEIEVRTRHEKELEKLRKKRKCV